MRENKGKEKAPRRRLSRCAAVIFWLGIWFLLAAAVDNGILLAAPLETGKRILSLLGEKEFYVTVCISLLRIGGGFTAGLVLGLLLAAAGCRFLFLEELLAPLIGLMKTVPVASFAVLLLIWWGSSGLAAAVCLLVVLPNVYVSMLEGLKSMDVQLLEMAEVFRLPFWSRFFYIYRPQLKPFLWGSLKVSLGMCWKAGVAAEVIGIPAHSIGERLYLSKIYLDTAGVFAWTAVVVLISSLLEKLVLGLAERFFAWEPACGGASCSLRKSRELCEGGIAFGAAKERGREQKDVRAAEEQKQEEIRTAEEGQRQESAGAVKEQRGQESIKTADERQKLWLQLQDITKSYDGRTVLAGVSAVYEPGGIYWLTGPSGSGKTTLLRILAGLTMPDRGICRVPGRCSMAFQEDRLCQEYSAVRNVELVTGDRCRAKEALRELLEEDALYKPCSRLSGGMKRRVTLVRAMEADSAYILLDEPFTGMDGETRRLAEEYIRRRQGGRTVVIAFHEESGPKQNL